MRVLSWLGLGAAIVPVLVGLATAKEWKHVTIGTEGAYPPFNYIDSDKKVKGFDVDIAMALCEKMEVTCSVVTQDWDGIIPALLAGKYDAIVASMAITSEREKQVAFTNKYFQTPPAVVVPKDSPLTDLSPEVFEGLAVGAQSSTTHAAYAEQELRSAELKLYPTADEYRLDLASGRLDAAIDDSVVLEKWVKSAAGACCRILGHLTPIPAIHGRGAGIAVRKEDTDLRDRFNKAIEDIRADGTYKRINDIYFGFDVYGE